jgi:hypothetical protein
MKNRFPSEIRASWRQRFLAIARELESAATRRESLDAVPRSRARVLAPRLLRGVRLACIRVA